MINLKFALLIFFLEVVTQALVDPLALVCSCLRVSDCTALYLCLCPSPSVACVYDHGAVRGTRETHM